MNITQPSYINPLPHAMRWGLTLGLLFSANFLFGTSTNILLQTLTYAITVSIAVITWRVVSGFRDNESRGIITFYRVFSYIIMLYFFAALVSAIVKLIYLRYINPTYLQGLIETTMKFLSEANIELPAGYEQSLSTMLNPIHFIMQITMFNTLIGAIIGLFYAPFIKRSEPDSNKHENTDL